MIMQRQPDGTYAQIGFIKSPTEDIDKIVDRNGDLYFEKGFTRQVAGYPATLPDSIGKPLLDYKIYGNIYQDTGTVTENAKLRDSNGNVIIDSEGNEIRTSEVVTYDSPSPESPAKVLGCGDRTRNLFDFKTIYSDTSMFTIDGESVTASNMSFNATKAKLSDLGLSVGDTFCFSATIQNNPPETRGRVAAVINGVIKSAPTTTTAIDFSQLVLTMETLDDVVFITYGTSGTITASNIQLELGTEATPYVPYGYEIPVVSRGKNLFDFKTIYSDTSSFTIEGDSVTGTVMPFFRVKTKLSDLGLSVGDTFCFSATIQNNPPEATGTVVAIINGSGKIGNYNAADQYMSTVSSTMETLDDVVYISYYRAGTITASNIQLELGTEPTEYEPYRNPITTPIYLPEPLYKDDYVAKEKSGGKAHRAWGVKVFDGTEKWYQRYSDHKERFSISLTKQINGYCTHYMESSQFKDMSFYSHSTNAIIFTDFRFTAVDDFKSFLASEYAKGTPVTVYYPLAEPTEESIDLPDIPTFDGTTIIETDTEIPSSKIEVSYKSKKLS